jgi:hypothetical protein
MSRQKRTQERIVACLAPLAKQARSQALRAPAEGALAREVSRRVIEAFTTMPVLFT